MTTTVDRSMNRKEARLLTKFRDPVQFMASVTGEAMYSKQADISTSIAENPRTGVVGSNSSGKDWLTGRIVLWWHTIHPDGMTVILGPTHRQVALIVWQHTRQAYAYARERGQSLGGQMNENPLWRIGDNRFAIGFATNRPYRIDGFHSPHLLVVITEAHQVEKSHFDAAERLMPERLVVTGNPFVSSGWYYDVFHEKREAWSTVEISAHDSPNVTSGRFVMPGLWTLDGIEQVERELGPDDPYFQARVLGQFPENLEDTLISMAWCKEAVQRESEASAPSFLGVDVAREGQDRSVVMRRDGERARLVWRVRGHDTEQVAGWVGRYAMSHPPKGTGLIVVDEVGIGAGVFDKLKAAGTGDWKLEGFKGGAKPTGQGPEGKRYADRNAQAWYSTRQALRAGELDLGLGCPCGGVLDGCETAVDASALDALIGQLSSRRYRIEGDQRIRLESKDDLKKSGRRSPDEADALCMTYGAPVRIPNVRFM